MAVNPKPPLSRAPAETGSEGRLYLREEELDRAADLVLRAAKSFWRAAGGALAEKDLGAAHYRALAAIRREEGLPVGVLQARLEVRKQSLQRVLSELEANGLIVRARGEIDRRERRLTLSPEGREAERAASAALRARIGQVFREAGADAVAGARVVLGLLAEAPAEEDGA